MLNINNILSVFVFVIIACEAFKVKINNNQIVDVDQRIDGNNMKEYGATSLDFLKNKNWKETILKIENFDYVQRISLDNNSLLVIPAIEDMPELRELSMNYNSISSIHTSQFFRTELTKIVIAYNSIGSIYNGAFNNELEELNLRCNELTEILSSWFTRPENLKILDLSYNRISSIKSRSFRSFTELTQLNLAGNKIKTIGAGSFASKEMWSLDLSMNKISELSVGAFAEQSLELRALNVTYNRLNFLSEQLVRRLWGGGAQVALFGNPWQCACLRRLEALLRARGALRLEPAGSELQPQCVASLLYPTACAELVEPELHDTLSTYLPQPKPTCPTKHVNSYFHSVFQ